MTNDRADISPEYRSHDEPEQIGSDRSFAFVFTAFFAIVGGLRFRGTGLDPMTYAAFGASGVFLLLGLVAPRLLHPLNVVWMKFAVLLNRIVSPIVMGLLFFFTITPMAILLRAMGKDLLRLKMDKDAKSYWIDRDPPGPPPESMSNQF